MPPGSTSPLVAAVQNVAPSKRVTVSAGCTERARYNLGSMKLTYILAAVAVATSGCGGGAGNADANTTTTVSDQLCSLAQELFEQDADPTAEQLERYQDLAPDVVRDAVDAIATPVLALGDDPSPDELAVAHADDDVEQAVAELRDFEEEECGIRHSEDLDQTLPEDASDSVEEGAAVVPVVATDFAFSTIDALAEGRTSFVLTNAGAAAHQLVITRPEDGGEWQSGLAAPGGEDSEALTFDLEPGRYELRCLVPTADGRTHADLGMLEAFEVVG